MKKTILLLMVIAILLPSQAFAATKVSTKEIERIYFEDYKSRVNEVRAAQKKIAANVCTDVTSLTAKSKASAAKYKNLVKSKASKDQIASAKADKDSDAKALKAAKADCKLTIKELKQGSNQMLKDIANSKAELIKFIKAHEEGKDKLSQEEFTKRANSGISYIQNQFDDILSMLGAA